ncbi:hypothetical protein [Paenibacillus spongiae]|uniref:Uncharacterized protein n=1 Tax=Paenibacillus spongiae TaxID=2909671 RepID=A0ABY5S703_9BACL|nr:hypothetical protein [Paenibacillus spongiae]UVI29273.1 hypothetical protein L1F29_28210 [Paenibacillus spongiae]
MPDNDNLTIHPYTIDRLCRSRIDPAHLTFQSIDSKESVFSRTLILLKGHSLPDFIYKPVKDYSSTLLTMVELKKQPDGNNEPEPKPPSKPPKPPKPPGPTVAPAGPASRAEPIIVSWDLFIMIKYRQDWESKGYGIGDLLYTTTLMPNEELTLEIKTWETSRTQQDVTDETDQRNVSDIKSTNSSSNETSQENMSKEHEYVDAKAGYSGFGFSAEVSAGYSSDVMNKHGEIAKKAEETSKQSTSEYRASHKVKLSLSRESGSETKTTRKIRNINQAHTLNASFYEVLQQFDVTMRPYDVTLLLLGAEPDLASRIIGDFTLGHLIRLSKSSAWIQDFIDFYGVSPIKLIRERWSQALYDGAGVKMDWMKDPLQIKPEDREEFRNTILQYVRPAPSWIEPDEKGALRWGYEILPGQELPLLKYIYSFHPYSVQQMEARVMEENKSIELASAYQKIFNRYTQLLVPEYSIELIQGEKELMVINSPSVTPLATTASTILFSGPFYNQPLETLHNFVEEWAIKNITGPLKQLQADLLENPDSQAKTWSATMPTQGVYSDVALGICSGAEDYYEIQRQFDLELKKLEVEKLKLANEKLKWENQLLQQGKSIETVIVQNKTDNTNLELDLTIGKVDLPTRVEITKTPDQ